MKAIKTLFIALALLILSCDKQDKSNVDLETNFTFKILTDSKIGVEKDGEFKLNVSNDVIMETFKQFVSVNGLKLQPLSLEVITIDNNKYLRFYNENDKVSTIELIKDENGQYRTGNTVCTSSACSSGGGCIPNGLYCTKCQPQGPNSPVSGDCKRVTTGNNL